MNTSHEVILNQVIAHTAHYAKVPANTLTGQTTLDEAGIGGDPIGHAEMVDFKAVLEHHFGVQFKDFELPDFFESGNTTLDQIAAAIRHKIAKTRGDTIETT